MVEKGVWGVVMDEKEVSEAALVPSQGAASTPSGGLQVLQELVFYIGLTKQEAWVKFCVLYGCVHSL